MPAVAGQLAALEAGLATALGPERLEAARTRGTTLGRGKVVEATLDAIDAALAARKGG
jgi:hypothetical protein